MSKRILSCILVLVLVIGSATVAFAGSDTQIPQANYPGEASVQSIPNETLKVFNELGGIETLDIDKEGIRNLANEIKFLRSKNFSDKEIASLGVETVFSIATAIKTENLTEKDIELIKENYIPSLLKLREEKTGFEKKSYTVDENGIVTKEDGIQIAIPNSDFYLQKRSEVLNNGPREGTLAAGKPGGVHIITKTKESKRFYQATGNIQLPNVTSVKNENDRPYMFFGGYGNSGGFDIGLVYCWEYGGWSAFVNAIKYSETLENPWDDHFENGHGRIIKTNKKKNMRLEMFFDNGVVTCRIVDRANWQVYDEISKSLTNEFKKNPQTISISREVSMAQKNRNINSSSIMSEAAWGDVYYYRSNGTNERASSSNLIDSADKLYNYTNAGSCYFYGDVAADINCIVEVRNANLYGEITTLKAGR